MFHILHHAILIFGYFGQAYKGNNGVCYQDSIDLKDGSCKKEAMKFDNQNTRIAEHNLKQFGENDEDDCQRYSYNEFMPDKNTADTNIISLSENDKTPKKYDKRKKRKLRGSKRKRKKEKKKKQWKRKRRK